MATGAPPPRRPRSSATRGQSARCRRERCRLCGAPALRSAVRSGPRCRSAGPARPSSAPGPIRRWSPRRRPGAPRPPAGPMTRTARRPRSSLCIWPTSAPQRRASPVRASRRAAAASPKMPGVCSVAASWRWGRSCGGTSCSEFPPRAAEADGCPRGVRRHGAGGRPAGPGPLVAALRWARPRLPMLMAPAAGPIGRRPGGAVSAVLVGRCQPRPPKGSRPAQIEPAVAATPRPGLREPALPVPPSSPAFTPPSATPTAERRRCFGVQCLPPLGRRAAARTTTGSPPGGPGGLPLRPRGDSSG
jgi:hypothetical protein